jgi:hypothetical protein
LEVGVMEDLKVAGLLRRQAGMLRAQGAMCMEHAGVLEGMAEVLGAGAPATLVTEDGQQLAVQEREQRQEGAERVARFDEAAGIQEQEGVPLVTPADRVDREKLERGS